MLFLPGPPRYPVFAALVFATLALLLLASLAQAATPTFIDGGTYDLAGATIAGRSI